MTDGIVFVLHGSADAAYAAALAAALAPAPAIPSRLAEPGARGVQFGSGGLCLVVWSRDLAAEGGAAAVLDALAHARGNAAICQLARAPLPATLTHLPAAPVSGDATADIGAVRGVLARVQETRAARASVAAPALSRAPSRGRGDKQHLAIRSATGIAATFAVVGMIAPPIAERAQASGPAPDAPAPAPAAAEPLALETPVGRVLETSASSATPLLDEWLPAAPAIAEAPTPVIAEIETAAMAQTAPIAFETLAPEPDAAEAAPADPKRAAWAADPRRKDAPQTSAGREGKAQPQAAVASTDKTG